MSRTPKAVLISDIHFTPNTLDLASKSLIMARDKAIELNLPLVIAGDTLDSKAIMRAECVNALIDIFNHFDVETYVIVGNHDLLNEKGEEHSLEFLRPYVTVVDDVLQTDFATLISYKNNPLKLQEILKKISSGSTVICHQGVQTAFMGHYAQDKTSLPKEAFSDFRTISGHYHRAQNIKCGAPRRGAIGLFSFIGTPYTTSFSEAQDGAKGFQILYSDGTLELIPTNLRKHVIIDIHFDELSTCAPLVGQNDLIWLKVSGPKSKLDTINKIKLGSSLFGHSNFKLELLPEQESSKPEIRSKTPSVVFDMIIDRISDTEARKEALKMAYKELLDEGA